MFKPKKGVFLGLFLGFLFLFSFLVDLANSKMSPSFPIANSTTKHEFALSSAFDGTRYLVPVMNGVSDIYAQFVNTNGTPGTKITIVENSTSGITGAKVAFGNGTYLLIWVEGLCD